MISEKKELLNCLEKVVNEKKNFEKTTYSQFLSVLNAKKEKIAELQEFADRVTSSSYRGT